MPIRNFLLILAVFLVHELSAQVCANLGQNPGTAFPVCGSSVFSQTTVAICGQRNIPTPCRSAGVNFQDKNPYWYKFTCFASGTLGFIITPKNLGDDYDWQLFDITGHTADEVYTNSALFVACNWSGESGKTGASSAGSSSINCEGNGVPLFNKMPDLVQGHNYLLLVSHFTDTQSGYSLSFEGGTGSITDTTTPKLVKAVASCDGSRVAIKLTKKMKCSSLASDGSDFIISGTTASITNASAIACTTGFDMDSLILKTGSPLPIGSYTVSIKKGTDNNTLLDNCDAAIPEGDLLSFTILPSQPAVLDSIISVGCAPDNIQVVFNNPVLCNSVAADGSDFILSGISSSTIKGATVACSNNSTSVVTLQLSSPITVQGVNTVTLRKGTDGNTVLNECSLESVAGANISFNTRDTVSADFDYVVKYSCKADTALFSHKGENGVNSWKWTFSPTASSTQQNPIYIFQKFGQQQVKLLVSNGTCSDSSTVAFNLDNDLQATITGPSLLCPTDAAIFKDSSVGTIVSRAWDFGNGNTSTAMNPPEQTYPASVTEKNYMVKLVVLNNYNCYDTAYYTVKVLNNCFIAVATAFSPNGDGLNDYLYPINAYKAKNLEFKVYNRFGQLLFQTTDFTNKWDGSYKGIKQATGTYVWTLEYINTDTQEHVIKKGTTVLIR